MKIETRKILVIDSDEMNSICQQIADRIISEVDSELFKKNDISIQLTEDIEASVDVKLVSDHARHLDYTELVNKDVTGLDIKLFDSEGDKLTYNVDLDELVIKLIETI